MDLSDLKEGMEINGTVRNVIDFGVFVDIGVHQVLGAQADLLDLVGHAGCNDFLSKPIQKELLESVFKKLKRE